MTDLNLLYEAVVGGKLEIAVETTNSAIADGVNAHSISYNFV